VPYARGNRLLRNVTSGWALDSLFRANTAPPVNVITGVFPSFALNWNTDAEYQRPNLVPGQPLYLYGSQYPGGKRINPAAFITPANQGDLGRNALRGFVALGRPRGATYL
jgi:hypothetical protein